jgi:hypothetical protein
MTEKDITVTCEVGCPSAKCRGRLTKRELTFRTTTDDREKIGSAIKKALTDLKCQHCGLPVPEGTTVFATWKYSDTLQSLRDKGIPF